MLHRIRECFNIKTEQLQNEIEVDETFIGGRTPNGQGGKGKTVVLGMVERSGKLISKVVENRKSKTLIPIIKENVKENSVINTDELLSYNSLYKNYNHFSVNHSLKEYVRGKVHTNTIEGFWSFLKRGFKGIYHYISEKHLQKYLDEFVFRYNMRGCKDNPITENERFNYFFCNMKNRLRYKDLICC